MLPVLAAYFKALLDNPPSAEVRQHAACFLLLVVVLELLMRTPRPTEQSYSTMAGSLSSRCTSRGEHVYVCTSVSMYVYADVYA